MEQTTYNRRANEASHREAEGGHVGDNPFGRFVERGNGKNLNEINAIGGITQMLAETKFPLRRICETQY